MQYSPRAIMWMTYLNYLPYNEEQQFSFLSQQHDLYESYIEEFINYNQKEIFDILDNIDSARNCLSFSQLETIKLQVINSCMDLSVYQQNEQLYQLIEKDIPRTFPSLIQLSEQIDINFHFYFFTEQYKRRKLKNDVTPKHQDILARILYIYGKLNPAIKYMQGMSDLLVPLYLILKNEADTFFCFTKLMAQVKDAYISTLDFTFSGIRGLLLQLEEDFMNKEPKLYSHLNNQGIHPYMFGYRWIVTCLTREFHIEQVFQIWDLMLQHRNAHLFIIKFSISTLKYLKPQLLEADFKLAFDILTYSEKDVNQILNYM